MCLPSSKKLHHNDDNNKINTNKYHSLLAYQLCNILIIYPYNLIEYRLEPRERNYALFCLQMRKLRLRKFKQTPKQTTPIVKLNLHHDCMTSGPLIYLSLFLKDQCLQRREKVCVGQGGGRGGRDHRKSIQVPIKSFLSHYCLGVYCMYVYCVCAHGCVVCMCVCFPIFQFSCEPQKFVVSTGNLWCFIPGS